MRLLEYQGKAVFKEAGIMVPAARVVRASENQALRDEACAAARELMSAAGIGRQAEQDPTGSSGGETAWFAPGVMVKAQVTSGGRGKAGLIVRAESPEDAGQAAVAIVEREPSVRVILLEQMVDSACELYLSISTDAGSARHLILASAVGGVEIETLAEQNPTAIQRVSVDPFMGLQPYQTRGLGYDLGFSGELVKRFAQVTSSLYQVFRANDTELAEINPLFVTQDGSLIAGDSKLIIDDNSLNRQPQFEVTREQYGTDTEYEAALEGIPYVQFDGDISLMCAGAGLTTTVYDLVQFEGGTVANYLEFGGPNYRKARRAMELCLKNRSSVILIVTFGTIARADVMAEGIVGAIAELKPDRPIVTCIRGTNEEAATETLADAGIEPLLDTEEAVRRAVAIAKGEQV